MAASVPYSPHPHLIATSGLTAEELISQFNLFRDDIRFVQTAPELVFERVLSNVLADLPDLQRGSVVEDDLRDCMDDLITEIKNLQEQLATLQQEPIPVRPSEPDLSIPLSPDAPIILPPAPIEFRFVRSDYGLGIRTDRYEGDRGMYGSHCQWPDLQQNDPEVEYGIYNTVEENEPQPLGEHFEKTVTFSRPFQDQPEVIIWLTGVDMRCKRPCHIEVAAGAIYNDQFTIRISVSERDILYSAGVAWMAYPPEEMKYVTDECGTAAYSTCNQSGMYHFNTHQIHKKALLAVRKLVMAGGEPMPFIVGLDWLTPECLSWDVTAGKSSSAIYLIEMVHISCLATD